MSNEPTLVLVVDDNQLNLELVTVVLEGAGYAVCQAGSGADGLEAARRERPSLILMDIGLPGMDGYAVLKALRGDPDTAGLPVVALTAYAMADDERRVREAGFDGYITKPIDVRALPHSVADHLARRSNGG
jgi:two-component system cell cycle response regulator DivK